MAANKHTLAAGFTVIPAAGGQLCSQSQDGCSQCRDQRRGVVLDGGQRQIQNSSSRTDMGGGVACGNRRYGLQLRQW